MEWWIQREFKVLPTDPRFTDLTNEQMLLIMEHAKLDNAPAKPSINDPDYAKAEQEHERYHDPDFDKAWDGDTKDDVIPNVDDSEDDPEDWKEVE